ncbi:hypothetical protein ACWGDX_12925 [Streptomyces sp. NPDC055025]
MSMLRLASVVRTPGPCHRLRGFLLLRRYRYMPPQVAAWRHLRMPTA